MKFLIMRMADANTEAGVMPEEPLLQALLQSMGNYNMALTDAGVMVDGMGLKPSSCGARIEFHNGVPTVTDGPFTESKELLAGFTLIQVGSKQEALDWVKRWPVEDGEGNVVLHLREIYEMEDFAPGDGLDTHYAVENKLQKQPQGVCVYLGFPGNCREAFNFYSEVLGGTIVMMNMHTDAPGEVQCQLPPDMMDKVMHALIQVGPYQIMGADVPQAAYQKPSGFHLQLHIDNVEQAEKTFAILSEGGEVCMPLAETFWTQRFGMLVDRFGTPWMINSTYKMFQE